MKKAIISLFTIASITAAGALFAADKAEPPVPVADDTGHPPFALAQGHGPMPHPPFPPQKPVIFSATVATDNPVETINKLTPLIPVNKAKHYEVRVEIVPVPDMPGL